LDIHGKRSFEWRHYNEFILDDPWIVILGPSYSLLQ
jgi:hypothetical protein